MDEILNIFKSINQKIETIGNSINCLREEVRILNKDLYDLKLRIEELESNYKGE